MNGADVGTADATEQVANAVLYEGFLLYPYRLSSVKNRHRWNFGVLYPEPFAGAHAESARAGVECLLEAEGPMTVEIKARFLQLTPEEALARTVRSGELMLADLAVEPMRLAIALENLSGELEVRAETMGPGLFKVVASVRNTGKFAGDDRDEALGGALISTHLILSSREGRFVSQIDPPAELKAAAAQCRTAGLWPVLTTRENRQMLAAPIILYDYPSIAPQSPGELFDGTEIDEILTLRVRTLTEGEKAEARGTDARVRSMLDRCEAMGRDELMGLHASMQRAPEAPFRRGDRVRLRPKRRADIFDLALAGRLATVISVEQDLEDRVHLCVTVDDDPGRDLGLEGKPGHRFFFDVDEVEPA